MTDPTRTPAQSLVVHVTLSAPAQGVAAYTEARCAACNRVIGAWPGAVTLEVRKVANNAARSGRGVGVPCKRCNQLCEVINHG